MIRLNTLKGFSILELYTAISIISILVFMAIPEYGLWLMRAERDMTLERIQSAIEFAKQEANLREKTISICPSRNQKTCHKGSWTQGFMVFENVLSHKSYPQYSRYILCLLSSSLH